MNSLILKGMGPGARLIVVGYGPRKLPVIVSDDDFGGTVVTLRYKEPWLERAWWHNAESYTVKATLLEINGKELIDPPSGNVSKTIIPETIRVSAALRWAKKIKVEARNIFINAIKILRS